MDFFQIFICIALVVNAVLMFSLVVMVRTAYMCKIYQKLRKEVLSDDFVRSIVTMNTWYVSRSPMMQKEKEALTKLRKVLGNAEAMVYFKFIPKHRPVGPSRLRFVSRPALSAPAAFVSTSARGRTGPRVSSRV